MAWNTFTEEKLIEMAKEKGYLLLSHYVDEKSKKRKLIVKDKYGYKYDLFLSAIQRNNKQSIVHVGNSNSTENIRIWLIINDRPFSLSDESVYTGTFDKNLEFHCKKCNDTFIGQWSNISQGGGCAKCDGKQVGKYNTLSYKRPDLLKDWDYNNNEIKPEEIVFGSTKTVFWICSVCGHKWNTKLTDRTVSNHGCSACCGRTVTDKNRFSILFPEIAAEWHPTKNGDLTPYDVPYGSNKKVWWLCPICGNSFQSWVANRCIDGRGCQKCSFTSGESSVEKFLQTHKIHRIFQYKEKECRNIKPLPFDFYLPDYNLCVEFHGIQHYELVKFFGGEKAFKQRQINDKIKKKYCKNNNINLLIIPYWDFDNIEKILLDTLNKLQGGLN